MKNILYAMIAMLFVAVGFVSANTNCADVYPDSTPAAVTGTVYDQADNAVPDAKVSIKCGDAKEVDTMTDDNGNYYVCFDSKECAYGDKVYAEAEKEHVGSGVNDSEKMCKSDECFIPIGIVDITIPEFGLIAGAAALIGALGIFMYKRK